ncbi:MAG: 30S ribosomal protein S13 [Parcubacteria group bacterium ADurb.Bin159]|nr:MAG: 30S ribosomal protein S13 [Parcubacteria group bacterium ADurb.Bin159]
MARIAGINLPPKKQIEIGLTYIFGIGRPRAKDILKKAGINPLKKVGDLTDSEVEKLRTIIEGRFKVEGALRAEIMTNIKRLKDIGSYRGIRHAKHLPARGQRTRVNTRTVRGNVRHSVGSGRKPPAQKT